MSTADYKRAADELHTVRTQLHYWHARLAGKDNETARAIALWTTMGALMRRHLPALGPILAVLKSVLRTGTT